MLFEGALMLCIESLRSEILIGYGFLSLMTLTPAYMAVSLVADKLLSAFIIFCFLVN